MMNKERWEHKLSQTLGSLCSNKDFFRLSSGLLDSFWAFSFDFFWV